MNRPTRLDKPTLLDASTSTPAASGAPVGLIAGDLLTLVLVTVYGFASHQTLGSAGTRILATLIPMILGWAAAAPFLGVYDRERATDPRQLWRPVWAMILGVPLAVILRGFWLQAPAMPVFAAVMAGVSAAGILIWRLLYLWIARRSR